LLGEGEAAPPAAGEGETTAPGEIFGAGEEIGEGLVPPPAPPGDGLAPPPLPASPPQAPRAAAKPITKVKRINPLFINTP